MGIITEVSLKIRRLPPVKHYGSIVFPDFESGVNFMREVANQKIQPSSIRLMDNEQFQFGYSLRPPANVFGSLKDRIKHFYIKQFLGFDLNSIVVTTLLFEGTATSVANSEELIYKLGREFGGVNGGPSSGERGYVLTFVIAYIRDIGLDYRIVAESFETSVPWSSTLGLCNNVKLKVDQTWQG